MAHCSAAPVVSAGSAGSSPFTHVSVLHLQQKLHRLQCRSCQLPKNTDSPAALHRQQSSCCKNHPHQPFAQVSETSYSTSHHLISNGSCVAMRLGELGVNPAYSSLPKSPASISLGYSSRRESRGFEILPAKEGCRGAKICKTQIWR